MGRRRHRRLTRSPHRSRHAFDFGSPPAVVRAHRAVSPPARKQPALQDADGSRIRPPLVHTNVTHGVLFARLAAPGDAPVTFVCRSGEVEELPLFVTDRS